MLKNYKKISTICLFILFSFNISYGQEKDITSDIPAFGVGIHVEQFRWNDIEDTPFAPTNTVLLTVNAMKYIKLEAEFGMKVTTVSENDEVLTNSLIQLGIGVFGMIQMNSTNVYGGVRISQSTYDKDYLDYNLYSPVKKVETTTKISLGPVIGFEYFFGKHFSFGGEMGLINSSITIDGSEYSNDDTEYNSILTSTGLILRFYL